MFIDAMARAGLRNGLSKQKALSIAASAVMGSAKLVSESGMHPYALIDSVTTPGGTTIEGVLTLQRCGFETLAVTEAFSDEPPSETAERIQFVARRMEA